MPHVRVLRPFMNGHADNIVHPGDVIEVDDDRARDLCRNGLVEAVAEEKSAPPPPNKAAPAPPNKAAPPPPNKAAPAPAPARRGPGRPAKVR